MARYRLVHVGTAALLSAAVITTVGIAQSVTAGPVGEQASSFVAIKPCRLMDTRPASAVGPRITPIGAAETVTVAVWGERGQCLIPETATGIAANVTVVNPTAASHLTVFPAEGLRPRTSNLNWRAANQPLANHVAVGLPAAPAVDGSVPGAIRLYNNTGTVDVIVDIAGYYVPALAGPQGPQGEQGIQGIQGIKGDKGDPGVGDLGCTTNQSIRWNGEAWECHDEPIVATLSKAAGFDPATISGTVASVFQEYSPNVTSTGTCPEGLGECNIVLTDVVDHTTCAVTFTGNYSARLVLANVFFDHITIYDLENLDGTRPFYVSISCNPDLAVVEPV